VVAAVCAWWEAEGFFEGVAEVGGVAEAGEGGDIFDFPVGGDQHAFSSSEAYLIQFFVDAALECFLKTHFEIPPGDA
jgi:hypothetical protein